MNTGQPYLEICRVSSLLMIDLRTRFPASGSVKIVQVVAGDMPDSNNKENLVLSCLTMRRILGALGLSLPFVVIIGTLVMEDFLRMSVSSFYYSPSPVIHDFFVGILCAMGVFLISYKGHERREDELISDDHLACAVAGAPTNLKVGRAYRSG